MLTSEETGFFKKLDLDPLQQKTERLIDMYQDTEAPPFWQLTDGELHFIPVQDGKIRVIHYRPSRPISIRPVLFVPGWGGVPEGYQDAFELLFNRVEFYYIETREKKSSIMNRKKAIFTMSQKAKDIQKVIEFFQLNKQDFVLFGACWGSAIILQGLMDGTISSKTVVTLDPMHRLWYPQWMLNTIPKMLPIFVIKMIKPLLKYLKVRKIKEPRQRERAIQFIENAVMWKWIRAAYHCRHFELFGNLHQIKSEVFVVNGTNDSIHNQEDYPKIAQEIPKGRFLLFETTEMKREALMGLVMLEFSKISQIDNLSPILKEFELKF